MQPSRSLYCGGLDDPYRGNCSKTWSAPVKAFLFYLSIYLFICEQGYPLLSANSLKTFAWDEYQSLIIDSKTPC